MAAFHYRAVDSSGEAVAGTMEADSLGNSKATINLDINENVTARGSVGSDGNTTIGIFFEKDY